MRKSWTRANMCLARPLISDRQPAPRRRERVIIHKSLAATSAVMPMSTRARNASGVRLYGAAPTEPRWCDGSSGSCANSMAAVIRVPRVWLPGMRTVKRNRNANSLPIIMPLLRRLYGIALNIPAMQRSVIILALSPDLTYCGGHHGKFF